MYSKNEVDKSMPKKEFLLKIEKRKKYISFCRVTSVSDFCLNPYFQASVLIRSNNLFKSWKRGLGKGNGPPVKCARKG